MYSILVSKDVLAVLLNIADGETEMKWQKYCSKAAKSLQIDAMRYLGNQNRLMERICHVDVSNDE